jgi:hypothetical protein
MPSHIKIKEVNWIKIWKYRNVIEVNIIYTRMNRNDYISQWGIACSVRALHGQGPSWLWSYGSWIYNYLCNQWLSQLTLWVKILLGQGVHDTTLCDKVCLWHAEVQWFSTVTPISSTNKTDNYDITEILLKVALNTIN